MLNTIDLFCGPGGITCGFKMTKKFQSLLANEFVQQVADTFEINNLEVPIIRKDIRKVKDEEILKIINGAKVDLVVGGPPCEGFSLAGERNPKDKRNTLFEQLIRVAKLVHTDLIMMENVPGLLSMERGKTFDAVMETFRREGFTPRHVILSADDFGVPQVRKRLFIFASKTKDPKPLVDRLSKMKLPQVTSGQALSDLPELEPGQDKKMYRTTPQNPYQKSMRSGCEVLQSHKSVGHRKYMVERYSHIRQGKGMDDVWDTMPDHVKPKKCYASRCRRLNPEKPSPTVTSHCLDEIIHPFEDRAITPREAARLQSFPDNYLFTGPYVAFHGGKDQDRYEQIGDAVPPLLAFHIAKELIRFLKAPGKKKVSSKAKELIKAA